MSPKAHKSEYAILLVLALVTGLVLYWLIGRGMIRDDRSQRQRIRSTRSASDEGMLAWYMVLERLGVQVSRSNRMLLSSELEGVAVVFLIDPVLPVHTGEREDLGRWVTQGGVLITTERMKDLDPVIDDVSLKGSTAHYRDYWTPDSTKVQASAQMLPLAREVSALCFQSNRTFNLKAESNVTSGSVKSLFADARGVRIIGHRMGRGHVIVLSDSSFMTNRCLDLVDNPVLAANLVAYATGLSGGKKVVFDDYHFYGGGNRQGFLALGGMLFRTSAGWCVLTLTAAGVLYLILKGRRFGPRRDFRRQQRRRSKLEYVYAVGATYRAANAHGLTFQLIYSWFRQQIAGQTHLPPTTTNRLLAQELARRGGADPSGYERALDASDVLLSQGTVSKRELATAIERLAHIEKEILHGFGRRERDRR